MSILLTAKKFVPAFCLVAAALLGSPRPSWSDIPPCYSVCYYDTPCDWECLPDPHEPWISTCGDWGVCEASCNPNNYVRVPGTENTVGRNRWTPVFAWQDNCKTIVEFRETDPTGCAGDRWGCEENSYHANYPEDECWEWGRQSCS